MNAVLTGQLTRVLIVDDHPAVLEALANRIRRQADLELVGEAVSAEEAIALLERSEADVAVVDISLKGVSGLDLIKQIASKHPRTKVLVWSMHEASVYADRAMRAGAHGYITKEHATEQIVDAIRRVQKGEQVQIDGTAEPVGGESKSRPLSVAVGEKPGSAEVLSNRELEVFQLLGDGYDMHEISERMKLSVKTIETYRARIKRKLNVKGRTQLIQVAVEWALSRR
jgi:DNA-binding NarL/FixJ family response regulator